MAVGARCREQGDAARELRASITTRRCRPAATAGASSPRSRTPAPICGACRCSIGPPRMRDAQAVSAADRAGAGAALRRNVVVLFVVSRDRRRTLESRTDRRPKSGRTQTGRCPSRPRCRRTGVAWPSSSDRRGSSTSRSCRRTARTHERWRHPSTSRGGGQGVADWSPDGTWIVRAAATPRVRGCSRSRSMAARPSGSSPGKWSIRSGRRDGKLIVYAGPLVGGQVTASWSPTGWQPGRAAASAVRPGGYRFLPNGKGLVYLPDVSRWISGCSISPRRRPSAHPPQQSGRLCERSTSRRTGNTSCSTARGRTRTSS